MKLPSEAEREVTWQHWGEWHQHLQKLLSQHEPRMAAMLADVADPSPGLKMRKPMLPKSSFGVSPPTNQVNGTTMICSAAATAMDWTRTAATAFFQGYPQPNPGAVRTPQVPPNLPAQPRPRRKGSVKSAKAVDERQKKGHKRGILTQYAVSICRAQDRKVYARHRRYGYWELLDYQSWHSCGYGCGSG